MSYQTLGKVASVATVAGLLYQLQSNLGQELRSDWTEAADRNLLTRGKGGPAEFEEEFNTKPGEGPCRIEHMMYEVRAEGTRDFYFKRN